MSRIRSKKSIFSNPLVRKLEHFEGVYEGDVATYKGIFIKSMYFILMVLLGTALAFTLHHSLFVSATVMLALYAVAIILMLVSSIVSAISVKTTPVMGTLGSLAMGYALAFTGVLIPEYASYYYLAAVLTLAIVLAMMFVYFSGIIKVTDTFRKIIYTVLIASLIGGLLVGVCFLIPATRVAAVLFITNPLISLLCSVGGIILASLFLLSDFNTIERTVMTRLPRDYEWCASYSLIITVVWLYLEVLDLILTIKDMMD